MARRRVLLYVIIVIPMVVLGRYHWYVNHGASPYDEVGITLAGLMPEPIWA